MSLNSTENVFRYDSDHQRELTHVLELVFLHCLICFYSCQEQKKNRGDFSLTSDLRIAFCSYGHYFAVVIMI